MSVPQHPATRILHLVREEKTDVSAIYFYAIFNGLIQLSLPVGIQAIIGFIVAGTLSASLVLLITLIVGGVLLSGLLQMGQMGVIEKIQQKIFVRYAHAFADRIPRLDLPGVDGYYLPELVNRFFDTVALQKSISKLLLDLPVAVIQIGLGLILLSFYHPAFIGFGVLLVTVLWAIIYRTGSRGLESSLSESAHKYALAAWFGELARAVRSFKGAPASPLPLRKADERTIAYLGARTRHFGVLLTQYRTLVAFKVLITAATLIVGVLLLLDQQINIGQFVAAEIIIVSIISSVEKIIINLDSAYDVLTSVEKVSKLTDKPLERSGTLPLDAGHGIAVRASGLGYAFGARPVFRDVSFRIAAGEKVCISGEAGSGKSMLLRLMTGAYRDHSGALLVNEVPIGNYDLGSLREPIGTFFHGEEIFKGSLLENLTLGRSVESGWLSELVQVTGLSAFLETLPEGFDTELEAAGRRLPHNVVDSILLVRALVHRPRLLLMEDPLRGMPAPQAAALLDRLFSLPGTTVVLATNDPACTARAQQVICL